MQKPIISYYKSGDPTTDYKWVPLLTDINIILTKNITDEFIDVCLKNKHRIFLHINITGMGKTEFEPRIDTVKTTFLKITKLINLGFPIKQILVLVNPILPNDNGLRALELLLRIFTEFRPLRLRTVRLSTLYYRYADEKQPEYLKVGKAEKFMIANENINKRPSTKNIMPYLIKTDTFIKDYYKLISKYESIISVDKGDEPLIGVRELLPFGFNNSWVEHSGEKTKLIFYDKNNKHKPLVNIISSKVAIRCLNRCLLCPHKY